MYNITATVTGDLSESQIFEKSYRRPVSLMCFGTYPTAVGQQPVKNSDRGPDLKSIIKHTADPCSAMEFECGVGGYGYSLYHTPGKRFSPAIPAEHECRYPFRIAFQNKIHGSIMVYVNHDAMPSVSIKMGHQRFSVPFVPHSHPRGLNNFRNAPAIRDYILYCQIHDYF